MVQEILNNPAAQALLGAVIVAAVSEALPFLPVKAQGIIHGILEAIRATKKAPKAPAK